MASLFCRVFYKEDCDSNAWFPSFVAIFRVISDKLRRGETIFPEVYESSTVQVGYDSHASCVFYSKDTDSLCGNNRRKLFFFPIQFSDVSGFADVLVAAPTPYITIDIMNALYLVCDHVVESFDVYKIETVGDCYLVSQPK